MKVKDIYQYALGALIVLVYLIIVFTVLVVVIPEQNREIALLVIGALIAKFGDVVAYFYNSSKGSAEKTEMLNK